LRYARLPFSKGDKMSLRDKKNACFTFHTLARKDRSLLGCVGTHCSPFEKGRRA